MAPSTYYAAKSRPASARAVRDAVMIPVLVKLWEDNYSVYGARKLAKAARRAGHDIGRDQVARLMKAAGIAGVHRRRKVRTTKADPEAPR
ncbi:transposase, partial [Mycolicibacter algericus DSM 45454]